MCCLSGVDECTGVPGEAAPCAKLELCSKDRRGAIVALPEDGRRAGLVHLVQWEQLSWGGCGW